MKVDQIYVKISLMNRRNNVRVVGMKDNVNETPGELFNLVLSTNLTNQESKPLSVVL